MTEGQPSLTVRALSAGYLPDEPIIRDVDLDLWPGEVLGILGPNGAGKSTLLKALAGTCPYESGEAKIGDVQLVGLPANRRVRHGLGFVPAREPLSQPDRAGEHGHGRPHPAAR